MEKAKLEFELRPYSLGPRPVLLITTLCCSCGVNFGFRVGSPSSRAATDANYISSCSAERRLPLWVLPQGPRLWGTPVKLLPPGSAPPQGLSQRVLRAKPTPLSTGPSCHLEISGRKSWGRHSNFPWGRALDGLPGENSGPQVERHRLDVTRKPLLSRAANGQEAQRNPAAWPKTLAEAAGTQGHANSAPALLEPTGRDEKCVALFQLNSLAALHAVSQEDVTLFA